MTKQSKLCALPLDDKKRLLELCAQLTYDQIVALAAQPRDQGGLDLKTNRSALSRFYLDHADIAKNSLLASELFDITDTRVFPADDLLPQMTNLLAQSAFLLLAHNRPFQEYHRVLNDFFRLERITRTREKHLAENGGQDATGDSSPASLSQLVAEARKIRDAALAPQPSDPNNCGTKITPSRPGIEPMQHHPAQPKTTTLAPTQNPPPPKLDFELPSFTTPKQSTSKHAKKPTHPHPTAHSTLHLPPPLHFPAFSLENPRNLINLTKSH